MAPTPDPVSILQRLAALSGAGRPVPADLASEVVRWLADAAGPILNGAPVAETLGLAGQRGAWQNAPRHRARFDRRDRALRELWNLTDGDARDRAWQVQDWVADWSRFTTERLTSLQARLVRDSIPDAAREHLESIEAIGLPVPAKRTLLRVVRPASQNPVDAGECGSLPVSASASPTTSTRT